MTHFYAYPGGYPKSDLFKAGYPALLNAVSQHLNRSEFIISKSIFFTILQMLMNKK